MRVIFKLHNVIFEKGAIHPAKQAKPNKNFEISDSFKSQVKYKAIRSGIREVEPNSLSYYKFAPRSVMIPDLRSNEITKSLNTNKSIS